MESSIPLSEYASKLEEHVKQRYLQKIWSIGVDPALIEGKLTLLTFRVLALRQREIRHRISCESRVSIVIIHAVNIRETVDNEMAKRYAKSWNAI